MTPADTARLRFRPLSDGDCNLLFEMFADPEARRFYPQMAEMEKVTGWVDWNLENYREHGMGLWAVERRDTGDFVGDCGLTLQDAGGEARLEVGYHVTLAQRGNGFASEAARAAMAFGFANTNADSICSIVAPDNVASIRVATRVHQRKSAFVNGKGHARLLFETNRGEL